MSIWDKHPTALTKIIELRDQHGLTLSEICRVLTKEFGDVFTYESVRSKLRRHEGRKSNKKNKETYLIISDLHIPFHREDIDEIIKPYAKKVDALVIAGDFLDLYACSSFVKDKYSTLRREMIIAHERLSRWSKLFKKIIIFPGNHEERLNRYFASHIDQEFLFLVDCQILNYFVKGFEVEDFNGNTIEYPPIKRLTVINDWHYVIGDAVIAHPKDFSKVNSKVAVLADEYFTYQGYNHRCAIVGHTHQAARVMNSGNLAIEIGCCCEEQDYAKQGKLKYRPQTNAICLLTQENGVTDFNRTNFIVF